MWGKRHICDVDEHVHQLLCKELIGSRSSCLLDHLISRIECSITKVNDSQSCLILHQLRATQNFLCEALQGIVNAKPNMVDANTGEFRMVPLETNIPTITLGAYARLKYTKPEFKEFLDSDGNIIDNSGMQCKALKMEVEDMNAECISCKYIGITPGEAGTNTGSAQTI